MIFEGHLAINPPTPFASRVSRLAIGTATGKSLLVVSLDQVRASKLRGKQYSKLKVCCGVLWRWLTTWASCVARKSCQRR